MVNKSKYLGCKDLKGLKVAFFSHLDFNLYRFRLPLMTRLISEGAHVYAIAPEGSVAWKFQKYGVEFISFEVNRRTSNPFTALNTVRRLISVLKDIQSHILHTFTLRPNVYGAFAGQRAGIPVIVSTVTGLGSLYVGGAGLKGGIARAVVNLLTRFALGAVSAVVFQNPDDMQYYLDHRLCRPDQAYLIVSSGVDLKQFSPERVPQEKKEELRKTWGISPNEVVIIMVARLVASKGVYEFLEAARQLCHRARFVLIGEPDPGNPTSMSWEELSDYAEKGVIIAPGRQENIPEWLAISDLFVLPSYYREGVPRTILEAMAMGLPIVTTDSPGCRETVVEGQNGFLIPPRNVDSLVQALNKLIDNAELRERMGTRSRELAVERFSSEKITSQYIDLYKRLLSMQGICSDNSS
jgi:N,N'-diacetylbacillosaminyl-diphospho-undecaprenol alpha-1,3-N-acetylgalactosaminyltransferase